MNRCRPLLCVTLLLIALQGMPLISLSDAQEMPLGGALSAKQPQRTIPAQLVVYPTSPNEPLGTALPNNPIATPQMVAWLTQMIHDNLPPTYEDDRKWNQQKEVWDGLEWRREGLKLETKRRKKMVNAGSWTRYAIAFVEPEKNLHVEFYRLEPLPEGKIAFGATVDCSLDVFGRLSQWVRDVQVFSISIGADAAARLTLEGTVQFQMNLLKLPPDVAIKPHVDKAHVELTYYRVRNISQIGGDTAKILGNGMRGVVDEKIEDLNGKLVGKINTQLEKHSNKMSFSTQDWMRSKLPFPTAASE